jgi:hypothetical protein
MSRLSECSCGNCRKCMDTQSYEGSMAKHDAMECADDARDVADMIQETDNLPEWLEAKITLAADYMNKVKDYLTHYMSNTKNQSAGFGGQLPAKQNHFVPAGFKEQLIGMMGERIEKTEAGYFATTETGKRLSKQPKSKKAALQQLAAVEISKHNK